MRRHGPAVSDKKNPFAHLIHRKGRAEKTAAGRGWDGPKEKRSGDGAKGHCKESQVVASNHLEVLPELVNRV
jgi:hypothetical protein